MNRWRVMGYDIFARETYCIGAYATEAEAQVELERQRRLRAAIVTGWLIVKDITGLLPRGGGTKRCKSITKREILQRIYMFSAERKPCICE